MKKLIILFISLLPILAFSVAGEGGSGGGPRTFLQLPELSILPISSIETLNREIIFKDDIINNFKIKNGVIIDSSNILNIEMNTGEILIP